MFTRLHVFLWCSLISCRLRVIFRISWHLFVCCLHSHELLLISVDAPRIRLISIDVLWFPAQPAAATFLCTYAQVHWIVWVHQISVFPAHQKALQVRSRQTVRCVSSGRNRNVICCRAAQFMALSAHPCLSRRPCLSYCIHSRSGNYWQSKELVGQLGKQGRWHNSLELQLGSKDIDTDSQTK
jgi:hypothetical protein